MKKKIALLLACVMAFGIAVGGTLAWLTAESGSVVNTFTDSDINITLAETKNDFKMVPGYTIEKDPKVTVADGSEACWLFVKVTESATPDLDAYISYDIASGWQVVEGDKETDDEFVIGRKVLAADMGKALDVIGYTENGTFVANKVLVNGSVTKDMMDEIDGGADQPTLTFIAYASQLMKNNTQEFTAAQAWANIADANANGIPDANETT